ncbi:MAG: hypothetical protein RSA10_01070 [Bacilli bacterium]
MYKDDELIVKTLTENNLFENYKKTATRCDINLENDFFNSYHFNASSKHYFDKNIERDRDGFIKLDETPFIISNKKNSGGHSNGFWILLNNGSKVFLKEDNLDNAFLELMFMYLAKNLNISCANYDIVTFKNKLYIASLSFLNQKESLNDYYNLESIFRSQHLNPYPEIVQKIEIKDMIKKANVINHASFLRKTIFIDTLTNNRDRFPHNFKVITNDKKTRICPLFDNGGCCDFVEKNFFQMVSSNGLLDIESVFMELLNDGDFNNWIYKVLNKLNVDDLLEKIYNEKKIIINHNTYNYFKKTISNNKDILNDTIKIYTFKKRT